MGWDMTRITIEGAPMKTGPEAWERSPAPSNWGESGMGSGVWRKRLTRADTRRRVRGGHLSGIGAGLHSLAFWTLLPRSSSHAGQFAEKAG